MGFVVFSANESRTLTAILLPVGGHIKPGRIARFAEHQRNHGTEMALQQTSFEKANFESTVDFISNEGLADEVDLILLDSADVCMNEAAVQNLETCWREMEKLGADMSDMEFHSASAAAKV